jgi:hypothetical protein
MTASLVRLETVLTYMLFPLLMCLHLQVLVKSVDRSPKGTSNKLA